MAKRLLPYPSRYEALSDVELAGEGRTAAQKRLARGAEKASGQ